MIHMISDGHVQDLAGSGTEGVQEDQLKSANLDSHVEYAVKKPTSMLWMPNWPP